MNLRIPIFIETLHSHAYANLQVCRKIWCQCAAQKIAPIPFVASNDELAAALHSLKERRLSPGIFVLNTFWAEEIMESLEPLLGNAAVIFFCRRIYSERPASSEVLRTPTEKIPSLVISSLARRPTAMIEYSPSDSERIAGQVVAPLVTFLQSADFSGLAHKSIFRTSYDNKPAPPQPQLPPGGLLGILNSWKASGKDRRLA